MCIRDSPKSMGGLSVPGKVMAALFQSVSTRTAGMNTIDLAACGPITKPVSYTHLIRIEENFTMKF